MKPVISFENVVKSYKDIVVLDGFTLDVFENEFVTVIGRSGSGKTTALRMVNGLNSPDSGRVTVLNENLADADLIALRRNIGYVIQGIGLFPHMTVGKNISYVPELGGKLDKKQLEAAVERLMDVVGLEPEMAQRYPAELSGGQRQRVGIARALAASPKILLMDEPFSAVDEITRRMLQDEILQIHKEFGVTVLFITHDIREAMKLGSRMLVMDGGQIIQIGTPQEIYENPATDFVRELTGQGRGHG